MILVPCPHCGPRNVSEFRHVGEAIARPDPSSTTPEEWRDYLYGRDNPAGLTVETWYHRAGCRAYFGAERDTVTNSFRRSWVAGQLTPHAATRAEIGDGVDASAVPGDDSSGGAESPVG